MMTVLLMNGVAAAQGHGWCRDQVASTSMRSLRSGSTWPIAANLTDGSVDAQDVTLLENGQPLEIEVAPVPTDGLEVVLLIDAPGSMNESSGTRVRQAGGGRIPRRTPRRSAGRCGRVRRHALACQPAHDGPQRPQGGALTNSRRAGRTAMYDGIVFGDTLFSGGSDRSSVRTVERWW